MRNVNEQPTRPDLRQLVDFRRFRPLGVGFCCLTSILGCSGEQSGGDNPVGGATAVGGAGVSGGASAGRFTGGAAGTSLGAGAGGVSGGNALGGAPTAGTSGPGGAGGSLATAGTGQAGSAVGGSAGGTAGSGVGGSAGSGGGSVAGSGVGGSAAGLGGSGVGGAGAGAAGKGAGGSAGMMTGGTGGASNDLCDVGVWNKSAPVPLTLSGNTFAHDPTMIEDNGTYYRFWTGVNIPMAKSTNLTSWQDGTAVYRNGYPAWVNTWLSGVPGQTFNFPWAPDVSRFNGRIHIYSSFSAKFGDNISCITHLSTDNIAQGNWTDHGPVICSKGDENYNAIDADVALDTAGTPWLSFGSFWDGIMAFRLNADGSRAGTDMTVLASASEIEAPVILRRCGYYYLFVTWGLCCPGEGRTVSQLTYRVAVGRSTNIMGPYVDKNGTPMVNGGGTLLVQGDKAQWAAAGHSDVIVSGDKIYHFYHAYRQPGGQAQLRIVELPFDDQGWPVGSVP